MNSQLQDQVREHGFDGIQEFDNKLPNWWLWTFYGACIFSFFYWAHYHVLGTGDLPGKELQHEQEAYSAVLAEQAKNSPVTDESLTKLMADPVAMKKGETIFKNPAQCAMCHKPDGGGLIGPNLTDKFWIHGSKPTEIYKTISKGVPEKGMLAWESTLGPIGVQQATAYVLSLRNTNVAGGKAPEGKEEGK